MTPNDDNDNALMGDTPRIISLGQINMDNMHRTADPDLSDLPVIPTRDLVLFPGVTFPITMGRETSIAVAQKAADRRLPVAVICQRDSAVESPSVPDDLHPYGVTARVMKIFNLPNGAKTAIVQAIDRIRMTGPGKGVVMPGLPSVAVEIYREPVPRRDAEMLGLAAAIKETAVSIIRQSGEQGAEMAFNIENQSAPEEIVNLVATQAPIPADRKIQLLALQRIKPRAFRLLAMLSQHQEMANIMEDVKRRTHESLSQQQRSVFLQQQMESIRQELYGEDDEVSALRNRAADVAFPDDVRRTFNREADKLSRLSPQSPDYAVLYNYLDLLLELPWGVNDPLSASIAEARDILEEDHFGLEKVKERIIEQLAVLINTPDGRSPIICLVGAPGVGKTSLGQSIARALGRKYRRVSLGGLHDEAEIRGHRRTYIGAMPGRIIDAIRRAGAANPVVMLDEIDKIGADFKGDPSAALLEVLDPEQNAHFHDNYIDVDFDLSKVLFIATANTLQGISQPLLDRMEVIDISGYLMEEKIEIARRHLLPRRLKEHNLTESDLTVTPEAIRAIIEGYTGESGVRQLEKQIATLVRRTVLKRVSGESYDHVVTPEMLRDLLGVETYTRDRYEGNGYAGVVTGLAWTAAGGEILYIESSPVPGKAGDAPTMTGNLGNVMKESAQLAMQYLRSHAEALGVDRALLDKYTVHIHVPEGAIPKDGPSAGITMVTSMVSALTRRRVAPGVAMTGEITLRGKVLPVGGIKEKILAAKRAGITRIILSERNRKDVEDIKADYLEGLTFDYVSDISQVIDLALLDELVDAPLTAEKN